MAVTQRGPARPAAPARPRAPMASPLARAAARAGPWSPEGSGGRWECEGEEGERVPSIGNNGVVKGGKGEGGLESEQVGFHPFGIKGRGGLESEVVKFHPFGITRWLNVEKIPETQNG